MKQDADDYKYKVVGLNPPSHPPTPPPPPNKKQEQDYKQGKDEDNGWRNKTIHDHGQA